ncbi:hypothetical protein Ais01nite_80090 [Asanoa ishikariensis]|uniref:WD40 repeat n=1 Tax=Asanoa ishikariensis TaxID=137265 RepID=A0A1H3UXM4_9ACTN|nr:TIR domain-containing protein [Asanoa ishikariensis]GIF69974.1 hypothetical protein Ais01nite_80090 [Asanoa ishikariensis]SDZ67107.1 WD40 repeat [Asanoa ishikariensis]
MRRPAPEHFDAFISYSQALSGELATQLQRWLERFATPWYRPRTQRIFRDYTNLSSTHDLTGAIYDALAISRFLVILASPAAAQSKWVNNEVTWWRENRPAEQVIVVLTAGELRWDDEANDWHWDETTPLPPAARGMFTSQPLWTDLSSIGDARELDRSNPVLLNSVAQIAARLRNTELDQLVGEHIRLRRRTRNTIRAVVATLTILLLATLAATWVAVDQRDSAVEAARIAVSRQLLAESSSLQLLQPGLARQLMAAAYRMAPNDQTYGALLQSPAMPGMLQRDEDVSAVAYTADGRTLAVADGDSISLIDTTDDATVSVLAGFGLGVSDIGFDRSGRRLVGTGRDGTIRVWDLADRENPRLVGSTSVDGSIDQLALNADGTRLATVERGQTWRLWDVSDAAPPTVLATLRGPGTTGSPVIALTDDGALLATTDEETGILLYSLASPRSPKLAATLTGHTGVVETLDFSPGGAVLASGGADDTVRLWGTSNPGKPRPLPALVGHAGKVGVVAFNRDGSRLASADWTGSARIWDTSDPVRPPLVAELAGHREFVNDAAFSPDSRVLATASSDDTVRLWYAQRPGASMPRAEVSAGASHVFALDPRAPRLLAGSALRMWNIAGSTVPEPTRPLVPTRPGPDAAAWSPDGRLLASDADAEGVRFWDTENADDVRPAGRLPISSGTVDALVFSPRDRTLAVAGADAGVFLSDVTDPRRPGPPRTVPVQQPVAGGDLAISGDGNRLAVTTPEGFELWNIADWRERTPSRVAAVTDVGRVDAVAFAPGTTRLATAGEDGQIRIWDHGSDTWRQVNSISGHRGAVSALTYLPDGRTLASGGEDQTVRLWRTPPDGDPASVATFSGHATSVWGLAAAADGSILVSADQNGYAFVWQLDPETLLSDLCRHSGPSITADQWRVYVGEADFRPPCV